MHAIQRSVVSAATALGLALGVAGCGDHDHEHGKGATEERRPAETQKGGEEAAGHSHERASAHGGVVTMSKEFHFETLFGSDSVIVHVYDSGQAPVDPRDASGEVSIEFKDGQPSRSAPLGYMSGSGGPGHLHAEVDLSGVGEGDAKASVRLTGLPGKDEKEVTYRETVSLGGEPAQDHSEHDHSAHEH